MYKFASFIPIDGFSRYLEPKTFDCRRQEISLDICQHRAVHSLVDLCLDFEVNLYRKCQLTSLILEIVWKALSFWFNMVKFGAVANLMFSSTYDEDSTSEITCGEWVHVFRSADFNVEGTSTVLDERNFSKIQNYKHYCVKTRFRVKRNWQICKWHKKVF